jgi:hypothetical protein
VKFNLGYVRLTLNGHFNAIDFLIDKKVYKNQVEYEIEESQRKKFVSITCVGNVPIKIKSNLLDKNINDNLKSHSIRVHIRILMFFYRRN